MRYARTGQPIVIIAEAVSDTSYLEYTSTVENLTAYGSDDGAESVALTGVTAVWDVGLGAFRITVPANQCPAEGHMFYGMVDWAGIIDVKFEFYMTNAESNVAAIKAITDLLTLANIKTQASGALTDFDTATPIAKTSDIAGISITASAGVDKVIPYGSYGINPAAKTITFSGVYESLTIEQILFIKNLTTNYIIYDCKDRDYTALPIYKLEGDAAGIFHYTADNPGAASTDLLHISVNQVPV